MKHICNCDAKHCSIMFLRCTRRQVRSSEEPRVLARINHPSPTAQNPNITCAIALAAARVIIICQMHGYIFPSDLTNKHGNEHISTSINYKCNCRIKINLREKSNLITQKTYAPLRSSLGKYCTTYIRSHIITPTLQITSPGEGAVIFFQTLTVLSRLQNTHHDKI